MKSNKEIVAEFINATNQKDWQRYKSKRLGQSFDLSSQ